MSEAPDERVLPADEGQGISLDELSRAFAQAMGAAPSVAPAEAATPDAVLPPADEAAAEDPCPLAPRSILEAMLFVGDGEGRPLSARRAAELMRGVEPEEVDQLAGELNAAYAARGAPFHLVNQGGGWRLTLRTQFHPLRNRFYGRVREARLSRAAVDVLAIVAYQQPVTAEQVGRMRGKPSGAVLAQLVHRGLLGIQRDGPKRRAKYSVSERFLELFGLASLEDLPHVDELERQ